MIAKGSVFVDGKAVTRPHHKVASGSMIRVLLPEAKPQVLAAQEIPLDVVYEDEHVLVVDKPAGLVVHPAPGNPDLTLVNALLHHTKDLSDINPLRPGIVHRLDKETSGIMVVAKTNQAHIALARQFAEHSIKRRYVALVRGKVEFDEQVIELPIGRDPVKRKSMAVDFKAGSRYARTRYRVLKRTDDATYLELEPFTGRTHQLRVHLSFIGHPVLGDTRYGKNNQFRRMALHALYLGFVHPATGAFVEFSSPVPREFQEFIASGKTGKAPSDARRR
jgi:23S rRNA pseudouridine1911/1915/1917 synthase